MATKEEFIDKGFSVVEPGENKISLPDFIKENYPQIVRGDEVKLDELKAAMGLPVDEKVNGYGLNFVGRNVARAKYAQKTAKELKINETLSKEFDNTKNMVLKGDNLDCLKLLMPYYRGRVKCVYIDPPYNTDSDEFVYPDKFDREEAEVLGLANLSETDMARLEFSFKTKKSHNGWLSFMYPRLLLARDLLAGDGVIFISIDDNEQANLKLLCDEIFGEENLVETLIWKKRKTQANLTKYLATSHDFILMYAKDKNEFKINRIELRKEYVNDMYKNPDNDPRGAWRTKPLASPDNAPNKEYELVMPNGRKMVAKWRCSQETFDNYVKDNMVVIPRNGEGMPNIKVFLKDNEGQIPNSLLIDVATNEEGSKEIETLLGSNAIFSFPKPVNLIIHLLKISTNTHDIILDFFAGSATTAHAVMQLNAEDNGARRFILCQIDEPIKDDKPAHAFCIENGLPPVISSITVERLRRAGEKLKEQQGGLLSGVDAGFRVFDVVDAPKLEIEEETGQIVLQNVGSAPDPLSRIYNMILSVGIDDPSETPECVLEKCSYKIGGNYYITNADKLDEKGNLHILPDAIKKGRIFIDAWTASINTTLQNYKEAVNIVF